MNSHQRRIRRRRRARLLLTVSAYCVQRIRSALQTPSVVAQLLPAKPLEHLLISVEIAGEAET